MTLDPPEIAVDDALGSVSMRFADRPGPGQSEMPARAASMRRLYEPVVP